MNVLEIIKPYTISIQENICGFFIYSMIKYLVWLGIEHWTLCVMPIAELREIDW